MEAHRHVDRHRKAGSSSAVERLKGLVDKKYRCIDRKWDPVFWITAAFIVGAACDITKLLFAGDWDFWTDWKDRQWWPILTPFSLVIIGSALQYIQWLAWRFPTGMTYTAICLCPWPRWAGGCSGGTSCITP